MLLLLAAVLTVLVSVDVTAAGCCSYCSVSVDVTAAGCCSYCSCFC